MHVMKKRSWICIAAALAVGAAIFGTAAPLRACEGHNHRARDASATSKKVAISSFGKMHRASIQPSPAMSFVRAKDEPSRK